MKKTSMMAIAFAGLCLSFHGISETYAQSKESVYDYKEAFNPQFYTHFGNPYRSASGKPGHQYWQNAASYDIKVS